MSSKKKEPVKPGYFSDTDHRKAFIYPDPYRLNANKEEDEKKYKTAMACYQTVK